MSVSISNQPFQRIGIVGAGNMGSMMALAFSELGVDVSLWDVKSENVDEAIKMSEKVNGKGKVEGFHNPDEFTGSLENTGKRRLYLFSITHGDPADSVLSRIRDKLNPGDIILDGGNEHYRRTEQRQEECAKLGVQWIGMGVSGGYQSARHGPSLSPGGDADALRVVMPLLEAFAAKDPRSGCPCVVPIGPAGSGHYVKMVHNGIEVGMLSTIAEAWYILYHGLGLSYHDIGNVFNEWNSHGELRNTYLLDIGVQILHTRHAAGDKKGGDAQDGYVLDEVLDKVVQDDDGTEGTPSWCVMDSTVRHVSIPTLATAYYLRVASGDRAERLKAAENLQVPRPKPMNGIDDREAFLENLRRAVYCSFLASFCQGLELIARASEEEGWDIDLRRCLQIWRAGCIIQAEGIADLLQSAMAGEVRYTNMKLIKEVARDLHKNFHPLKEVVLQGMVADQYVTSMSASLEYIKYEGGTSLPTQFMEGQMDLFGGHAYDKPGVPGEDPGGARKGAHHFEWRPA